MSAPGLNRAPALVLLPLDVEYTDATPLWLWLLLVLVIDGAVLTENSRKPVAAANIRCALNLYTPLLSEATLDRLIAVGRVVEAHASVSGIRPQ